MCTYKLAFDADFTPSRCEARPVTAFKHIYISDFNFYGNLIFEKATYSPNI